MVGLLLSAVLDGMFANIVRILESMKAGKRLPETTFANLKVAPKSQKSVYGMFKKSESI